MHIKPKREKVRIAGIYHSRPTRRESYLRMLAIFVAMIAIVIEAPTFVDWGFEKPTHIWYRFLAMVLIYTLAIYAIIAQVLLARCGLMHPAD